MKQEKENVFDLALFKRLLKFIKPYRLVFILTFIAVVGLSVFGAARPNVLQQAIDNNIAEKAYDGFLLYVMIILGLLILEVISNLIFIYYGRSLSFIYS